MADSPPLRIFISSPSDVRPERLVAERVVRRLAREFGYHFRIEPVLWEHEPLLVSHHFQDLIVPPRETDIVVTVLWSRLGVALPSEKYRGAISQAEVTGTEWEFEDAIAGFRNTGRPDLLLYRKLAKITVELGDRATLEAQQRQAELVDAFMRRWFRSADGGSFTAASWEFRDTTEFETLLEEHLRALLRKRLTRSEDIETPATIAWHRGSPFRSLESFELEHAPVFFGRSRARNDVRAALERQIARDCGFVMVIGGSGSGKSSLVKAGVLPDLLLPGMVGRVALCRHAIMRPGSAQGPERGPVRALAQAILGATALPELADAPLEYSEAALVRLLQQAPSEAAQPIRQGLSAAGRAAGLTAIAQARLVVVVDQFEELFTAGIPPDARERFVAALDALARSGLVWVLATMRNDFFDRVASLPVLTALCAADGTYVLTPPDAGEIGQMIRRPAREAGLRFEVNERAEQALDEVIREAASSNPGALPLLSYLLDQLWQRRSANGTLSFAAYEALGGLEGAIGRRAEEMLSSLPAEVRDAFPAVLRALVTVAGSAAAPTARTAPLSHFAEGSGARQVVDALSAPAARILTLEGGDAGAGVRVAHEALLTHWERARQQIAADRRDLRARARLDEAEGRWREAPAGDRASLLLASGLPLSEAEDLVARHGPELGANMREFVALSGKAARDAERRRARVRRFVTASFGVAAVVATALAFLGWSQWLAAGRANQTAETVQRLARHIGDIGTPAQRSLLLAAHAAQLADDMGPTHRLDAVDVLRQQLRLVTGDPLLGHEGAVRTAAISADGRWLATGSDDGGIRLWQLDSPDPGARSIAVAPVGAVGATVTGLAFSPDGAWLISGGRDGTLRLWHMGPDGASEDRALAARGHGAIADLKVSPRGQSLAIGTDDGRVCIGALSMDGLTDMPCSAVLQRGPMNRLAFSGGGKWLVAAALGQDDNRLFLWKLEDGRPPSSPKALKPSSELFEGTLLRVALNADDTRLAAGYGYIVQVWDLTQDDPAAHVVLSGAHGQWISALDFSPDGRWLVTGSGDTFARLWDLANPQADAIRLNGHSATVQSAAFTADSRWLATAGDDATVLLWDLREPRAPSSQTLRGQDKSITRILFGPDSHRRVLVALGQDRAARLWMVPNTAMEPVALADEPGVIQAAAISPDGTTVAGAHYQARTVLLWSVADPRAPARRLPMGVPPTAVAFSKTGRWLTAGSDAEHTLSLWDLSDPAGAALKLPLGGTLGPASLGFSPDGDWLVAGSWTDPGTVRIWKLDPDRPPASPPRICPQHGEVRGLGFSRDGRYMVTGGSREAVLWDFRAEDPCASARTLPGHTDQIVDVQISADGRWLATASFDHLGRLFAVEAGQDPRLVAEARFKDRAFGAAFSPDGHWAAFVAWDATARLFDLTRVADKAGGPGAPLTLTGHQGRLLGVAFSADSRWLATAGEDRTVRLWDPGDTKSAPVVLRGHQGSVVGAGFFPDQRLLSYGTDGTLLVWRLGLSDLTAIACRIAGRELTADEVQNVIGHQPSALPCRH